MADQTGMDTTVRARGVQYKNRVVVWNGRNRPRTYDGVAWANCGIVKAVFTPTVAAAGTGTLAGSYRYYVLPVNSKKFTPLGYVVAGFPSAISAAVVPATQGVTVSGIPATHDDSQVDEWHIYRNKAGDYLTGVEQETQAFYYIGKVAIGTTSYTDVSANAIHADETLVGTELLRFNRQIPPTFKQGAIFGERLFGLGFDPITTGTATVNATTTLIDFSGVSLPDGVAGCWFKVAGQQAQYRITARNSTTRITLDRAFVGALSAGTYAIYRYPWEIYHSEFQDVEAWGPAGEAFRWRKELPGFDSATGLIAAQGKLLVFSQTNIYAIFGKGPNPEDIGITTDPLYPGIGAVSGDSIFQVEGSVYFMSLRGPAVLAGGAPQLIGAELNTDWLDSLTSAEMARICGGSDGESLWWAYPVTGQTENSLLWRFDRASGTWWQEKYASPLFYYNDADADGIQGKCFFVDGRFVLQADDGALDYASAAYSGTVTLAGSLFADDSGAAWPTTGGGLERCWVLFYTAAGALHGARRITSNTATRLNWVETATLPGSGNLTDATGMTYKIGTIPWRWRTRTFQAPAHWQRMLALHAEFEGKQGSSITIYKTDYVDGVAASAINGPYLNNDFTKVLDVNQGGRDYAALIESRTGAILRQVTAQGLVEEGTH